MNTTAQVLRDAKALIADPDHWIKGHYKVAGGGMCSLGAIKCAGGYKFAALTGRRHDAAVALLNVLPYSEMHREWGGVQTIADFNDDPTTTHADVMAAFDRAIAAEESA